MSPAEWEAHEAGVKTRWDEIERLLQRFEARVYGKPKTPRPKLAVIETPGRVRTSKRRANLTLVGRADDGAE